MMRRLVAVAVTLGLSFVCAGEGVTATKRPSPPSQICIGSNCATTPTPGGKIKWNPGHYGASSGLAYFDSPLSKYTYEMDTMLKDDWVVGYRLFITWAALDAGPITFTASVGGQTKGTLAAPVNAGTYWAYFGDGEYRSVTLTDTTTATWSNPIAAGNVTSGHLYNTALLDQMLDRLKTHYNKPKQLVIAVVPMGFSNGGRKSTDNSRVPKYITSDPAYGPSPDGSTYGWWGPPTGQTTGHYTGATYRPAVAVQYAALGRALGAKYDSDPNFEAIMDQETGCAAQAAFGFPPADPSYSDDAYVAQMKMYLTAWVQAFPHTSVVSENSYLRTPSATQQFEAWIIDNRIAPGAADITGQSYYDANPASHLSNWGLSAYAGQVAKGSAFSGSDQRGVARPMVDIEGPDIGTGTGLLISASPLDIATALNKTVKASHAFWVFTPGGKKPVPTWSDITAVLKANPLTNIGYPGNYP